MKLSQPSSVPDDHCDIEKTPEVERLSEKIRSKINFLRKVVDMAAFQVGVEEEGRNIEAIGRALLTGPVGHILVLEISELLSSTYNLLQSILDLQPNHYPRNKSKIFLAFLQELVPKELRTVDIIKDAVYTLEEYLTDENIEIFKKIPITKFTVSMKIAQIYFGPIQRDLHDSSSYIGYFKRIVKIYEGGNDVDDTQ